MAGIPIADENRRAEVREALRRHREALAAVADDTEDLLSALPGDSLHSPAQPLSTAKPLTTLHKTTRDADAQSLGLPTDEAVRGQVSRPLRHRHRKERLWNTKLDRK